MGRSLYGLPGGIDVPLTVWNYANYVKEVSCLSAERWAICNKQQKIVSKCPEGATVEDVSEYLYSYYFYVID